MLAGLNTFIRYSGRSGNKLPYDAEVEYLESTGMQWIDTGYVPQVPITERYVLVCTVPPIDSNWQVWFGVGAGDAERTVFWRQRQNLLTSWQAYIPKSDANYFAYATVSNVVAGMNVTVIVNQNGGYYQFADGITRQLGTLTRHGTASTVNNKSVFLFKANNAATTSRRMKIFRFYINDYATGEMLLDMIPVRKGNVGYMYDRVSGKLFGNQGTGDFVLGPDIIPVEYLESTGTQYINTGIRVDNTCGYNISFMGLDGNDRIVMGVKGAGDSRWCLTGNLAPNVNMSWNTVSAYSGLGLGEIQKARMNYLNDRKQILNGVNVGNITSSLNSSASSYDVCMFAGYWGSATVSLFSTARVYSAQISRGNTSVRDFIPVRVGSGSTWEGAMLDRLTHKVYRNAGTGNFLYGNDKK